LYLPYFLNQIYKATVFFISQIQPAGESFDFCLIPAAGGQGHRLGANALMMPYTLQL
jgi:hypothetical protein